MSSGRRLILPLILLLTLMSQMGFAQDAHHSFVAVKAGFITPSSDIALTEGVSILFGMSPNLAIDVGVSYYEVNRRYLYTTTDVTDNREIEIVQSRYELSLSGTAKYFLTRMAPSSVRPFIGGGLGFHQGKGEVTVEGDTDSSLKKEFKVEKSTSTVSIDPVVGVSTMWTPDLMLFGEVRYMIVLGEKYNETSLTSGFALRI